MGQVPIRRSARIPDPLRLSRYEESPEVGPKILFFSGGTALRGLAGELTRYTHNSIHLVTPFDSGGSSAALRKAFGMLSVGDLRNRLCALSDPSPGPHRAVREVFSFRFPMDASPEELERKFLDFLSGKDPAMAAVPSPERELLVTNLERFHRDRPEDFDLRGASLGNLLLVGSYLSAGRRIEPALFLFGRLLRTRGTVLPIVDGDYHLAARLQDGTWVLGQHRITGKECPPPPSPIEEIVLSESHEELRPAAPAISRGTAHLIREAELVCFPMGSFYTSLLAHLLVRGVGEAVLENNSPKVYIPNTGEDPEEKGLTVADAVEKLVRAVKKDSAGGTASRGRALDLVFLDLSAGDYGGTVDTGAIRRLDVEPVDLPLVTPTSRPYLDPGKVAEALLSMV